MQVVSDIADNLRPIELSTKMPSRLRNTELVGHEIASYIRMEQTNNIVFRFPGDTKPCRNSRSQTGKIGYTIPKKGAKICEMKKDYCPCDQEFD